MPNTFLHGVETIQVKAASGVLTTVKTSVIGLIGTASIGPINELRLCTSAADDAEFGVRGGGTISTALSIIREQYKDAFVFVVCIGDGSTTPVAADFIGAINGTTGAKTGLYLFDDCYSVYGFLPKVFIAPTYSATGTIANALRIKANAFRGASYIDTPAGMTIATALLSRGTSGLFEFSDYRCKLLYPTLLDAEGESQPYSPYAAGVRARVDNEEGFWYSSSNHEINGIQGLDVQITAAINDATSDTNKLNAIGLTTVLNTFGTGFREWGNRNSAFPVYSDPRTFEAIQRLDDITSESIELAMLPFIDKPMGKAQIDLVSQTVQNYFNKLIKDGALLPGSRCYFDPTRNTVQEMAAGHFVWTKEFMGAVPGERLTFYSVIDTNLLTQLIG